MAPEQSMHSDDTRLVFYGVGAYVGRIDGETRCAFWPIDPHGCDFDPERLIAVDLSLCPARAFDGKIGWDQVIVDDPGVTTIGPMWPKADIKPSRYVGAVYLEERFLQSLRQKHDLPVPPERSDAWLGEYQTIVYRDGKRKGHRYRGCRVRIEEGGPRGKAKVKIFQPGGGQGGNPLGPFDLDLDSLVVDPTPVSGAAPFVFAATARTAADGLYVSQAFLDANKLDGPKLPEGDGR